MDAPLGWSYKLKLHSYFVFASWKQNKIKIGYFFGDWGLGILKFLLDLSEIYLLPQLSYIKAPKFWWQNIWLKWFNIRNKKVANFLGDETLLFKCIPRPEVSFPVISGTINLFMISRILDADTLLFFLSSHFKQFSFYYINS